MDKKTINEIKETNAIAYFQSLEPTDQRIFIEKLEDLRDIKLGSVPKDAIIQNLLKENKKLKDDNIQLVKINKKLMNRDHQIEVQHIHEHPDYQTLKTEKNRWKKSVKKLQDEVAKYRNICISKGLI